MYHPWYHKAHVWTGLCIRQGYVEHWPEIMAGLVKTTELSNVSHQWAKNIYFNNVQSLCRSDPKKMWAEIKRLVPGKNKHSHIICDISANDFNHHFANIGNEMNSKFQTWDDDLFWEVKKFIHNVLFTRISNTDIIHPIIIYWVWTSFYWKIQPHIFLSLVFFNKTGRVLEIRLSIRIMETLMKKIIVIQYLS